MSFHNRVRLPLYANFAQFASTREEYTKSNGETKILSAVLKKNYQVITDWIPESWHEKINVAVLHDDVTIEGDHYLGGIALDGEYVIDWDTKFRTPIAPAKFQILVTPFDNSNNNCQTCDEASQIMLVDDTYPTNLAENTAYTLNVIGNDDVCCYPVVFSITSFNTDYLSSCTIDVSGVLHFHTKTPLTSINGVKLATYRATCANGGYDEADVFANVTGSIAACLAPTGFILGPVTINSAVVNWTPPASLPNHYHLTLYTASPFTLVQSVDVPVGTNTYNWTGLSSNKSYKSFIRSQCDATNNDSPASNYVEVDFTTNLPPVDTCGRYFIFCTNPSSAEYVTYLQCDGTYNTVSVPSLSSINICALQTSAGVYTSIYGSNITIHYSSGCV